MKNAAKAWTIAIVSVVLLLGCAGIFAYRAIASTSTVSPTCPSSTKDYKMSPHKGTYHKEGHEGHFNKEAHKGLSDKDGNKTCPYKGTSEKKDGWVHPQK